MSATTPSHLDDGPRRTHGTDGTILWKTRGVTLHRDDGPAIEHACGTREWYRDGKLHRLDGPAIYGGHGPELWYAEGKLHRIGGPAIDRGSKVKYIDEYFVHNQKFTEDEYYRYVDQITGEVFVPVGRKLTYGEI